MPSIGTAKISIALGETDPAPASSPVMATAMENPGALTATPMKIYTKNDKEFTFKSVLIIPAPVVD